MNWYNLSFNQLSKTQLFTLCKLRIDVFVVEQQCPYPELDEHDTTSTTRHLLLYDEQQLCGYARCLVKPNQPKTVAIGRVLIASTHRKQGLAQQLMQYALEVCEQNFAEYRVVLAAQTYLVDFYQSFGFKPVGTPYLEDNIPHQDMEK